MHSTWFLVHVSQLGRALSHLTLRWAQVTQACELVTPGVSVEGEIAGVGKEVEGRISISPISEGCGKAKYMIVHESHADIETWWRWKGGFELVKVQFQKPGA